MLKMRETFDLRPDWVDIRAEVNSSMIFQLVFSDEGLDLSEVKVIFSVEDDNDNLLLFSSSDNGQIVVVDRTILFEIPSESIHGARVPPGVYRYAISIRAVSGLLLKILSGFLYVEEGV